jgi:ubiquitin-protein ligase
MGLAFDDYRKRFGLEKPKKKGYFASAKMKLRGRAHPQPNDDTTQDELTKSAEDSIMIDKPSIVNEMQNLHFQTKAFEKNAQRDPTAFEDEESKAMLELCQQVSDFFKALPEGFQEDDSSAMSSGSMEEAWFREHCVKDVEDSAIMTCSPTPYYHAVAAAGIKQSAPGRMKRLIVEMTTLATSLPEGIFVRHEMSRPDIIKALIIGPSDTPYANGAFEFDIFCPAGYPTVPPQVQFRTTGGGTEGMNPNLYPDGKVCLSLLGTWQGQPWQPGKSTLLQVLVSLQAMVFCPEPFYNEPGWSHTKNDVASNGYNANLYRATTQWAIIQWLEALICPPKALSPTPIRTSKRHGKAALHAPERNVSPVGPGSVTIWHDVLVHHFSTRAPVIRATIADWSAKIEVVNEARKKRTEELKKKQAAAKAKAEALAATAAELKAAANKFGGSSSKTGGAAAGSPPPGMDGASDAWSPSSSATSSAPSLPGHIAAAIAMTDEPFQMQAYSYASGKPSLQLLLPRLEEALTAVEKMANPQTPEKKKKGKKELIEDDEGEGDSDAASLGDKRAFKSPAEGLAAAKKRKGNEAEKKTSPRKPEKTLFGGD